MVDEDGNFGVFIFLFEVVVICFGGFWIVVGELSFNKLENVI